MRFLDLFFPKPDLTDSTDDKTINSNVSTAEGENLIAQSQEDTPIKLNTLISNEQIIKKFEDITELLKKTQQSNKYRNSVTKQPITEYDITYDEGNGKGELICEIKQIVNDHGGYKCRAIVPAQDTDGDGDIDVFDTQEFILSYHPDTRELRFEHIVIDKNGSITGFVKMNDQDGLHLLMRIEQFLLHGKASKKDLNSRSNIFKDENK